MPDASAAAELVRRAFEMARTSGKEDWMRMTIPVLKNRILTATGGKFRESEFGAGSFRDFLTRLPSGLVTLDDSRPPGFVVLNTEPFPKHRPSTAPRIRSDLWRAALDYSSGRKYIWDNTNLRARPATATEQGPFIPTATSTDLSEWRAAFAKEHAADVSGDGETRLQRWVGESLPTAFLPPRLQPLWNTELKRRVEERLQEWFRQNHLDPPTDLVSRQETPAVVHGDVERLRRFVLKCVKSMTEEELSNLQIPASVAMRVKHADGE